MGYKGEYEDFSECLSSYASTLEEANSKYFANRHSKNPEVDKKFRLLSKALTQLSEGLSGYPEGLKYSETNPLNETLEAYELVGRLVKDPGVVKEFPKMDVISDFLDDMSDEMESLQTTQNMLTTYIRNVGTDKDMRRVPTPTEPSIDELVNMKPEDMSPDEFADKFLWLANKMGEARLAGLSPNELESTVYGKAYYRLTDELQNGLPDVACDFTMRLMDYKRSVYHDMKEEYDNTFAKAEGETGEKSDKTIDSLVKGNNYRNYPTINSLIGEIGDGSTGYLLTGFVDVIPFAMGVKDEDILFKRNSKEAFEKRDRYLKESDKMLSNVGGYGEAELLIENIDKRVYRTKSNPLASIELRHDMEERNLDSKLAPVTGNESGIQDIYAEYVSGRSENSSDDPKLEAIMSNVRAHVDSIHSNEKLSGAEYHKEYVGRLNTINTQIDEYLGGGKDPVDEKTAQLLQKLKDNTVARCGEVSDINKCIEKAESGKAKREAEISVVTEELRAEDSLREMIKSGTATKEQKKAFLAIEAANKAFGSKDNFKMTAGETLAAITDPKYDKARQDLKEFRSEYTKEERFETKFKDDTEKKNYYAGLIKEAKAFEKDNPLSVTDDKSLIEYVSKNPKRVLAAANLKELGRLSGTSVKQDSLISKKAQWMVQRAAFLSSPYYGAVNEDRVKNDIGSFEEYFSDGIKDMWNLGYEPHCGELIERKTDSVTKVTTLMPKNLDIESLKTSNSLSKEIEAEQTRRENEIKTTRENIGRDFWKERPDKNLEDRIPKLVSRAEGAGLTMDELFNKISDSVPDIDAQEFKENMASKGVTIHLTENPQERRELTLKGIREAINVYAGKKEALSVYDDNDDMKEFFNGNRSIENFLLDYDPARKDENRKIAEQWYSLSMQREKVKDKPEELEKVNLQLAGIANKRIKELAELDGDKMAHRKSDEEIVRDYGSDMRTSMALMEEVSFCDTMKNMGIPIDFEQAEKVRKIYEVQNSYLVCNKNKMCNICSKYYTGIDADRIVTGSDKSIKRDIGEVILPSNENKEVPYQEEYATLMEEYVAGISVLEENLIINGACKKLGIDKDQLRYLSDDGVSRVNQSFEDVIDYFAGKPIMLANKDMTGMMVVRRNHENGEFADITDTPEGAEYTIRFPTIKKNQKFAEEHKELVGAGLKKHCEEMYRILDEEDGIFTRSSKEFSALKKQLKTVARSKKEPSLNDSRKILGKISKLASDYMTKKDERTASGKRLNENGALRYNAVFEVFSKATAGVNEYEKLKNPEHPIKNT